MRETDATQTSRKSVIIGPLTSPTDWNYCCLKRGAEECSTHDVHSLNSLITDGQQGFPGYLLLPGAILFFFFFFFRL